MISLIYSEQSTNNLAIGYWKVANILLVEENKSKLKNGSASE